MSEPKFKSGDLVRLKSGGPTMTVVKYDKFGHDDGQSYKCRWFDGKNQLAEDTFSEQELQIAKTSGTFTLERG